MNRISHRTSPADRLLKKVTHLTLPSHARRDARLTHGEAAGEKEPEEYPLGYIEDCFDPRTMVWEGRVLARRGWAGENGAFFSSLLVVGFGVARKLSLFDFFLITAERLERICLEMGIGFNKLRHEVVE